MLDRTFKANVARISAMWSLFAFSTFLLHFQLKYLYGNLFDNNNFCAVSQIAAIVFGGLIYSYMGGLKPTYYLAFLISSFGGLAILYRENNEEESQFLIMHNQFDFYRKMPSLIFVAKFGIAMGLIATELAAHTDDRLFPIDRRYNALALTNLIAFSCVSLAPMINEIDEPTPIIIFLLLMLILLAMAATFMVPP